MKVLFLLIIVISINFSQSSIRPKILVLEDVNSSFLFENVKNKEFKQIKNINYGYTNSTFWVKIDIDSTHSKSYIYYVCSVDEIEFYYPQPNGFYKSEREGREYGYINKKTFSRYFSFPLEGKVKGPDSYFFRIKSEGAVNFDFRLQDESYFLNYQMFELFIFGLFYGIILFIIVFNFLIFIYSKDKIYLVYIIYLLFFFFFIFTAGRHFYLLIDYYPKELMPTLLVSGEIIFLVFTRLFLNTKKNHPKIDIQVKVLSLLLFNSMLTLLFFSYNVSIVIINIVSNFFAIYLMTMSLYLWLNGYVIARFYFIAWTGVLIGGIVSTSVLFGFIDTNIYTTNSLIFGQVFEAIMMSFALADRFRFYMKELNKSRKIKYEAEKLIEIDRLKSRFFANISHEFRTPLTLIKGPLLNFVSDKYNGNLKKDSKLALKHTEQLSDLINQLLELSKIESGKLKLDLVKADIVKLINIVFSYYESYATSKSILFKLRKSTESFIYIFDPKRLEIVLLNLVSNALKFSGENGMVDIQFTVENNCPKIVISDNGMGIAEKDLGKIFDHFYQVDSSETRVYEGSGIGLSLVKEIVEMHQGQIDVQSKLCEGTSFIITLPIQSLENSDLKTVDLSEIDRAAEIDENLETITFEKEDVFASSVLIVEDNADLRKYVKDILSPYYQCFEAENGEKGLELAENEDIDLILSDVMMPKMDGFEFCKQLKSSSKTSHLSVLLLTARSEDADKIKGLEIGADDYLIKPFNQEELKLRIHNILKSRQVLREKYSKNIFSDISDYASNATDEAFIKKLNDLIKEKISEADFDRNDLANELGLSLSNLYRKIKSLTNMSPSEYIKSIRLKLAVEYLKTTSLNITEIALEVGFNNLAHFSREFKKQFGKSPKEYLK